LTLKKLISLAVLDGETAVPCNLQSAIAGLNSFAEALACGDCPGQVVLMIGSCATEIHEPRQVRKEATVSEPFRVPQGCLVGANYPGNAGRRASKKGARPYILKTCI